MMMTLTLTPTLYLENRMKVMMKYLMNYYSLDWFEAVDVALEKADDTCDMLGD
jgi:hypothetical protein